MSPSMESSTGAAPTVSNVRVVTLAFTRALSAADYSGGFFLEVLDAIVRFLGIPRARIVPSFLSLDVQLSTGLRRRLELQATKTIVQVGILPSSDAADTVAPETYASTLAAAANELRTTGGGVFTNSTAFASIDATTPVTTSTAATTVYYCDGAYQTMACTTGGDTGATNDDEVWYKSSNFLGTGLSFVICIIILAIIVLIVVAAIVSSCWYCKKRSEASRVMGALGTGHNRVLSSPRSPSRSSSTPMSGAANNRIPSDDDFQFETQGAVQLQPMRFED